jgi:plastocyanin
MVRARRLTVALGLVMAVLLAAAGCGGSGEGTPDAGATLSPTQGPNGLQIFTIVGKVDMRFSATNLTARPGRIRVDFSVEQQSPPHNFVIPKIPDAHTGIVSAGESQSVTFTADAPGTYPVICTLHPNMTATLTIV